MEKYGQYRDKGSGIAPFFPIIPAPTIPLLLPWHLFLFTLRIPLLATFWILWLTLVQFLPAGSVLRKANQWCLLGIPGVWWIDLQVDGVRRGSLSQTPRGRLPYPGTVIASSWTSPLDILYLAAIFDPIFTHSTHNSRLVRPISQESALAACFNLPNPFTSTSSISSTTQQPTTLENLVKQNPTRIIVVFPEATTSNGRATLRLTPSLLSAGPTAKVFPVSLRYQPPDVVTPTPGWWEAARFIWRLNSAQTHCIRVRIGGAVGMVAAVGGSKGGAADATRREGARIAAAAAERASVGRNGFESNFFDTLQSSRPTTQGSEGGDGVAAGDDVTETERSRLDVVANDLARLGRVKRVDLGVVEKERFVAAWGKKGRSR